MAKLKLTRDYIATLDAKDLEWAASNKWCAVGKPPYVYAARSVRDGDKVRMVYLHKEIAAKEFGKLESKHHLVQFINNNPLDCRRLNLHLNKNNFLCHRKKNPGLPKATRRNT